jgi:putative endonuclease
MVTSNDDKPTTSQSWFVYIIRCNDNSLYTGITTNLRRRLAEHNSSKRGARYTRSRRPVTLVYFENLPSRSAAASREYRIKHMDIAGKKSLINKSFQSI